MFRQGQLAVYGLVILLGRNEAGISNKGKTFLHHAVLYLDEVFERGPLDVVELGRQDDARPGAGLSARQSCHIRLSF